MRDYQAEATLGDDHLRPKPLYQRKRDDAIARNETAYMAGRRTSDDVRMFLQTARTFYGT